MCETSKLKRTLVFFVLLITLLVPIGRAYASEGGGGSHNFGGSYPRFGTVWFGPEVDKGDNDILYGVVANTKYDAAMYCLGYNDNTNDFSELLTPQKKVKLLNGDNDFVTFADNFKVGKPDLSDNIIYNNDYSFVSSWNSACSLYGETYCYSTRYTNSEKSDALTYVRRILAEQDSGGGVTGDGGGTSGSGGESESDIVPSQMDMYYTGSYNLIQDKERGVLKLDDTRREKYDALLQTMEGYNWFIGVATNLNQCYLVALDENLKVLFDEDGKFVGVRNDSDHAVTWYRSEKNNLITTVIDDELTFEANGDSTNWIKGENIGAGQSKTSWNLNYMSIWGYGDIEVGGDDDTPVEPPTVWPTPPSNTSTPPDVPTPDPNDPEPVDPVNPTGPNPWIPIPDESISITGQDFQDLLDALNEHCIHLQNAIEDNISQLWDLQSDFFSAQFNDLFSYLADAFDWLGVDVISAGFNHLEGYLQDLFEWLAERMNFNFTVDGGQYDDTSVIYWLKRIWSKLGSGDINTRPTDPVSNPSGWWDWLTKLLNDLAADLIMMGQDKMADVVSSLNQLRTKFPFSLPFDLLAWLGLLFGEEVCPEFDIPCFVINGNYQLQQVGTYHITLAPYETAWQGVKWIEVIAFTIYLITNTGGLMDMMRKTVRPR